MTSKKPPPKLSCMKSSCDIFWIYSLIMRSDSSTSAPCSSIASRVSGSAEGEIRIYEAVDAKAVGQALTQAGIAIEELGLRARPTPSRCFMPME